MVILKRSKIFLAYFPIILVSGQVLVNLLAIFGRSAYDAAGIYLNHWLGTNVLFSIFLVIFTWSFNFCRISKWAAVAESAFAILYMIRMKDDMYNIAFQIIVGTLALGITFKSYIEKFPLCRFSLVFHFIKNVLKSGNCKKGLEQWERDIKSIVVKNLHIKT